MEKRNFSILTAITFFVCSSLTLSAFTFQKGGKKTMLTLSSPAFSHNGNIGKKYTCDSSDVSVPLKWDNPPAGTKSFALIADDPDAPMGTWVHWVVYDIPATMRELSEGVAKTETLPDGTKQGITDFRRIGYGGPCPPPGPAHRYFFKLYALDTKLNLKSGATKSDVERAMKGHILDKAELMGKYGR